MNSRNYWPAAVLGVFAVIAFTNGDNDLGAVLAVGAVLSLLFEF